MTVNHRYLLPLVLVVAAGIFLPGINWGLPSRRVDPYLFGDRPVWSGAHILELAGGWDDDARRGADVDINPLADRHRIVVLNETDAQRAEIIRRYRLFTYQPDEMITLRALAGMKPGQLRLDPKLYQYGGLWIYPVGALLKVAERLDLVRLTTDLSFYLDHPEEFGRFYVVARFYVVLWALAGVAAVYVLTRRLTCAALAPAAAALCCAFMPVVVNMAHEAKPHLPGAVLILLATLMAGNYVRSGRMRTAIAAGALCGAAFGMVLSALPVFVLLPLMTLPRRQAWPQRIRVMLISALIGLVVYMVTNPYVPINALFNRDVLHSNLSNSTSMYSVTAGGGALPNALMLLGEATSCVLATIGAIGAIALAVRALKANAPPDSSNESAAQAWLLAVPALLVGVQFVVLARGKPGEYGRFAVLPGIALAIASVVAVATFVRSGRWRKGLLAALVVTAGAAGTPYLRGFVRDSAPTTSRLRLAERLRSIQLQGAQTLGVPAEPAPYCLGPVDLFRWKLERLPDGAPFAPRLDIDVLVRPVDVAPEGSQAIGPLSAAVRRFSATRISWADKPFEVIVAGGTQWKVDR